VSAPSWLPWVLGAAWGVVLALPVARRAARVGVVQRASVLAVRPSPRAGWRVRAPRVAAWWSARSDAVVVRVVRSLRARRGTRGDAELARELPVALDLLGVAVGAGCTPYLAVDVAAR